MDSRRQYSDSLKKLKFSRERSKSQSAACIPKAHKLSSRVSREITKAHKVIAAAADR